MVGLAIGMLATLIVMQVFTVFEAQKRTTTGAGDAQTNGNIALYNIAHELHTAGYALVATTVPAAYTPLKCSTMTVDGAAAAADRVFPVTIVDGVGGGSDSITIRYGDTGMGGDPISIKRVGPGTNLPTANDVEVANPFGCFAGDRTLVIGTDGTSCSLSSVSSVVAASGALPAYITLTNPTAAASLANLACLGTWKEITYTAFGGDLVRVDGAPPGAPLVAGVVSLQAQYGISAAGLSNTSADFNKVVQWVDAVNPAADGGNWAAPSVANRVRIKAVRIAVIARNSKRETSDVSDFCSSVTAATPGGVCAWAGDAASPAPTIDLSTTDADWKRYRYRVFETIVPLRNVIWAKSKL